MKYETGFKDKYGNRAFDWIKVCKDMKRVIAGKIKFSKALYDVMSSRFTIAHYDRYGWFNTYNGNWDCLAKQIHKHDACTGDLTISQEEENALFGLVHFLMVNADVTLNEEVSL